MKLFLALTFLTLTSHAATKITVSGISSGAYMAQQFHTAFSKDVSGVGIVAGGPYFCARGQIADALNRCMKISMGTPVAADSVNAARALARNGQIDPVENMRDARVYIITGKRDETVLPKVVEVAAETYKQWGVPSENIRFENKLNAGHAFPTENFGNACETVSQSPYISKCGRDVAGEILRHLIGPLPRKSAPKASRLFSYDQTGGPQTSEMDKLSMHRMGLAYIPEGCEFPDAGGCPIHVAFHGCKQTLDDVNMTFVKEAGYNAWAEANKIVIVYPQAVKNFMLNNPNGCWDWWGYTGQNYHTQQGRQMKQVYKMVKALREGSLRLQSVSSK